MTPPAEMAGSAPLIAALRDPARHPDAVTHIDVLETHISWVVLTGRHAYKIKKPVNLGFLDFSTLEARRRYCEEELRLNRRLAPSLYETLVKITGSADNPCIVDDEADASDHATAIEYAVRMREFPQSALAGRLLADGALSAAHIDALAARIAAFHAETGIAAHGCPYGMPEAVVVPARENFVELDRLLPDTVDQTRIAELRTWTEHEYRARQALFGARHTQGCVRECHGDLHLGNIVMLDGVLTPFDCIEFNPALRWIDVMNEVAFLVMDLMDRQRADFAYRFLNAYLEASDGYAGLEVLRFYLVYRATVRAKIHGLRAAQNDIATTERERLMAASRGYIELAQRCAVGKHCARPALMVMHGLSGSGKSVIAHTLAERIGAIRLQSDIERKRIGCLEPLARSGSKLTSGIYTEDLTRATYHRLLDLARMATNAGYAVVVDATFLKRWQRDLFRREADAHGIPLIIVHVTAPEAVLRTRIAARLAARGDSSEADQAVLTHQLVQREALSNEELQGSLHLDTTRVDFETTLREACATLRMRLISPEL
ncbi:MAG TPA: AAA family ATPase [Burkholderiales bacterium]|nr:AAA family ATPase [Burkholderiales bacterium]